ncbi:hypothetical protein FRC00_011848, partial [Tulasnella sp. 408]
MIKPVIGKGPKAIEHAIAHAQKDPGGVLGPWLMAIIGLTFMLGIFTIQVWRYFATFGYESKGIFTLVVACIVLSMLVKAAFASNGRATNGLKQTSLGIELNGSLSNWWHGT